MSDTTSDTLQGLPLYNQKLQVISAALLSAGIIYLIAANWLNFPAAIQLAIPQVLFIIACLFTIYFSSSTLKGHCSATFAALMIGLCFAAYGQIYQTGADSFQLFAVWTLLLLPWLYFRLPAIFSLFYITLSLTYYLANEQWLALDSDLFWLGFSILFLACLLIAQYCCPGSRLVLLLTIAFVSIMAIFDNFKNGLSLGIMSIVYLVPLLIAGLFYLKKWPVGIAIAILIFAVNTTYQFVKSTVSHWSLEIYTLFVVVIIIIVWCWLLSKLLQFCISNNLNWSSLPTFLGAWIAGLLLASTLSIVFNNVALILDLILLAVGLLVIKRQNRTLFIYQFGFAMALYGQLLFASQIINFFYDSYTLIIVQAMIVALSWYITQNQIWRTIQCVTFIVMCHVSIYPPVNYLIFIPFIIWLIAPTKFMQASWRRPLLFSLIAITVLPDASVLLYYSLINFNLFHLIALLLFGAIYIVTFRQTNIVMMILFIVLSILLLAVNLLAVMALLLALMLISQCHDKVMNLLLIAALVLCLFLFYCSLEIPTIYRGTAIIASGVLVGLLSYFNSYLLKEAK